MVIALCFGKQSGLQEWNSPKVFLPTSITATYCGVKTMNTDVLGSTGRLRNSLSRYFSLYYLMHLLSGNTGSRELAGLLWVLCIQLYYFILNFGGSTACQKRVLFLKLCRSGGSTTEVLAIILRCLQWGMIHENSASSMLESLPVWRQCYTVAENTAKSDQRFLEENK